MIETIYNALMDYGVLGLFVLYLIYDRQVLLRGITKALDKITTCLTKLEART